MTTQFLKILRALPRPSLALLFGGSLVAFVAVGIDVPEWFVGIAAGAVGYYYSSRQAERAREQTDQDIVPHG